MNRPLFRSRCHAATLAVATLLPLAAQAQIIMDGGFEEVSLAEGGGLGVRPAGPNWWTVGSDAGTGGIVVDETYTLGSSYGPRDDAQGAAGSQYGFLAQGMLYQSFQAPASANYTVSFAAFGVGNSSVHLARQWSTPPFDSFTALALTLGQTNGYACVADLGTCAGPYPGRFQIYSGNPQELNGDWAWRTYSYAFDATAGQDLVLQFSGGDLFAVDNVSIALSPVPESDPLAMFAAGLGVLAGWRRRAAGVFTRTRR